MNAKLAELARRREFLIVQLAAQRNQLAETYQQIRRPIQLVKTAITGIQTLKAHSTAAMGFTALLFSHRLRKYSKWPLWLSLTWLILRQLRGSRSRPQDRPQARGNRQ